MGIFDRLLKRDTPTPAQSQFALLMSDGITLTGYKRLQDCPEVVAAVNVYADLISSMTIYLMENRKKGDVRVKNALSDLIDITPNPRMSKRQFYSHIVRVLLLYGDGNAVVHPVIKDGLIDSLVPLQYDEIQFVEPDSGEDYYIQYKRDQIFTPDKVLHFRINPDPRRPWIGTGYTRLLADAVQAMAQSTKTKRSLMEQPSPSLIVKVDSTVDELASEEGRAMFASRFADSKSAQRPWFIPATLMDVEQIKPLSMRDLAVSENLELDKRQIAAVYGVPAFMVGVGEFNKAEYNNFIRSRVMPIAKTIEQELTKQLLLKPEWYFMFNPRSLMAYDLDDIVRSGAAMVDRMALSRNEWRDMIGMSPDDRMEDLLALENYIPQDMLGKQKKLVGVKDE